MFTKALILIAAHCTAIASAQQSSPLEIAKAIDQESRQLKNAAEVVRALAVKKLALRIRQQPAKFALDLAMNLAIDHADISDHDTVQELADTLVHGLRNAPGQDDVSHSYRILAELARYSQVHVLIDDPLPGARPAGRRFLT